MAPVFDYSVGPQAKRNRSPVFDYSVGSQVKILSAHWLKIGNLFYDNSVGSQGGKKGNVFSIILLDENAKNTNFDYSIGSQVAPYY